MTTQQSVFQMPAILVGIDRWMKSHRTETQAMIVAAFEGADQIRSNPAALDKAGQISAAVYKEESPEYWVKYFRGVTEPDAQGIRVHLGGSSVSNLADNLQAFGLSGGPSLFAATYNTFGKIVVQQYPRLVPSYPAVAEITDTSYINGVRATATLPENNGEDLVKSDLTAPMHSIEGRKNYSIQFATGSAQILASSYAELDQLAADISLTNYVVALHGHTDNAQWGGLKEQSEDRNMELSEKRAGAVKVYLVEKGVRNTIRVYSHGDSEPIADNSTAAGRALNRRVQVVLGE
jgi:outer membrane protein OmpA-like peptidoglycan-associated protein